MEASLRESLREGERIGNRYALQIPQVAASNRSGSRSGTRAGSSIDFQDYREYQPGDDLRFIDWSIYARTDRLAVKLFREEVTPHLDLILDGSRSMNLEGSAKARGVARLAALLASAAANAQCSRAIWLSGDGFQRVANDSLPPSAWENLSFESKRTPGEALEMLPHKLRRLGIRVFITDLLWPGEPMRALRRLRADAAALFVVQLLGRDDVTIPEHGNIRVADSETGEETEVYVDSAIAKQYAENLARLQQSWHHACRQCGAQMTTLIAEDLGDDFSELESIQLIAPA